MNYRLFKKTAMYSLALLMPFTMTSCNQGTNQDTLRNVYLNYCDGFVQTFSLSTPTNVNYNTYFGEERYSTFVWVESNNANEKYYFVKHGEEMFNQCGFSLEDYYKVIESYTDFAIELPNIKPSHNGGDLNKLGNSTFKDYSRRNNYYYSEDFNTIFDSSIDYKNKNQVKPNSNAGYYLTNTMIKGDIIMEVGYNGVKFVYYPKLSESYLAKCYKDGIDKMMNSKNDKYNTINLA